MLNRKASNILFYGSLAVILVVVLLIRTVVLAQLDDRIASIEEDNRTVQQQIDDLREIVQENKDQDVDHIYELYQQVPNIYNEIELNYYTIAQLELVGITAENEIQRTVDPNADVTFALDSDFSDLQEEFKIVEVTVTFNTYDLSLVDDFIDRLYQEEQVFIVNYIDFNTPQDGGELITVEIKFLAFYELQVEEES
jgi:hypothetical protein